MNLIFERPYFSGLHVHEQVVRDWFSAGVNVWSASHFPTLGNDSLSPLYPHSQTSLEGFCELNGRKPSTCESCMAHRKWRREVVECSLVKDGRAEWPVGADITPFQTDIFGYQSMRPPWRLSLSACPPHLCGSEFRRRPRISLTLTGRHPNDKDL